MTQLFSYGEIHSAVPLPAGFSVQLERVVQRVEDWCGLPLSIRFRVDVREDLTVPRADVSSPLPAILVPARLLPELTEEFLHPDLVHEVAHLMLFHPRALWISEGWAVACSYALAPATYFPFQLEGGKSLHDLVFDSQEPDWSLQEYLHGGSRAQDLVTGVMPHHQNRLAYARVGSFVAFLLEEHGMLKLQQLVQSLKATTPALTDRQAIQQTYQQSLQELEAAWRQKYAPALPDAKTIDHEATDILEIWNQETAWVVQTDQSIGGTTTADLVLDPNGFQVSGEMGAEGLHTIMMVYRFLHPNREFVDLGSYQGISFKAQGDAKNYQLVAITNQARTPGQEFLYLFQAGADEQEFDIPLKRLQQMLSNGMKWTGQEVIAIGFRLYGYKGQRYALQVSDVKIY
jgi:hypothetical protein